MAQSTGGDIRNEISNLLKKMGYKASTFNVEVIFIHHVGDYRDLPLVQLIKIHGHQLEN